MRRALLAAAFLPLLAACDNGATASQPDAVPVSLRFSLAGANADRAAGISFNQAGAAGLTVAGTNGTLSITDVRVIVSRFELRRVPGSCTTSSDSTGSHGGRGDDGSHGDCAKFRSGPRLLTLPLDGGAVTVATDSVAPGTYRSVRFKTEDFDDEHAEIEHHGGDDDDASHDADESAALQAVLAQMRATYPGFPSAASMVATGTFTPTGGTARPFTVYFRANLHVEKTLDPPLEVPGTQAVSVVVDPSLWFKPGAQVLDLSAVNGQTVRFEAEMERGFHHAEHEGGEHD
jgi:hypothetical protein